MSLFYRLAYALGIVPWDREAWRLTGQLATFFAREEAGRAPPHGPALDLGCGTGVWSVTLAQRGWRVVGVDNVPRALAAARARAHAAGVAVRFVRGDVTALGAAGLGDGFRFFLDVGCFHGLSDAARVDMGREVSALAASDATLVTLMWKPARRGPLPRGAQPGDLAAAFPRWRIAEEQAIDTTDLPRVLRNAEPRWFRLVHGHGISSAT